MQTMNTTRDPIERTLADGIELFESFLNSDHTHTPDVNIFAVCVDILLNTELSVDDIADYETLIQMLKSYEINVKYDGYIEDEILRKYMLNRCTYMPENDSYS